MKPGPDTIRACTHQNRCRLINLELFSRRQRQQIAFARKVAISAVAMMRLASCRHCSRNWRTVSLDILYICGICSIGHTLASLKATEAAMKVTLSEQTELLRRVLMHGETLQSHILHIGYIRRRIITRSNIRRYPGIL